MQVSSKRNIALIGAGRIGQVHARAVAAIPNAQIKYVVDVFETAAQSLAESAGASVASVEQVFADKSVNVVIIASSTDTHAGLLDLCATHKIPAFCEKPIDHDLERATACVWRIEASGVHCGLGFNRRHDPQFKRLKDQVDQGRIGILESLIITSRDPSPPPIDYVAVSGGLFVDMMIHDFDMARFILGEEPETLYAQGSCLVDPAIGEAGDIDTAAVTMTTASGKQVIITNSRRTNYGYDQRIEAFGSKGMLQAANNTETNLQYTGENGVTGEAPLHFFLERYEKAYQNELIDFFDSLEEGRLPLASASDGVESLRLALAAKASFKLGQAVKVRDY